MASKRDKAADWHRNGLNLATDPRRLAELLAELRSRSVPTLRDRWNRVRYNLVLALQAGLAAGLSWVIVTSWLKNPDPVFAPIAAVGTLAASVGQRFRRTVELIIGVTVGIAIGEVFILLFGIGGWQLAGIVTLAVMITIFLGGGPAVVIQAAVTALLLVALTPKSSNLAFPRVVDALVGGVVALIVAWLLLPFNPLRVVDRAARPALNTLANELSVTAAALSDRDPERAQKALDQVQQVEHHMQGLQEALEGGRETATLAPVRWRRRGALSQYVESAQYIEHAVANSGTLIRRTVTALEDDEPVPPSLPSAVAQLSDAVRSLLQELGAGLEPEATRERALRAVSEAGQAYADGVGFSGSVVVAQIRTTASDLLRATGIERVEANRLVRRAVETGKEHSPRTSPVGQPSAESDAGANAP
ncbi:aromatic acid exporter family protein, partial [Micromonospora zhanjiangensis]